MFLQFSFSFLADRSSSEQTISRSEVLTLFGSINWLLKLLLIFYHLKPVCQLSSAHWTFSLSSANFRWFCIKNPEDKEFLKWSFKSPVFLIQQVVFTSRCLNTFRSCHVIENYLCKQASKQVNFVFGVWDFLY